MSGQSNLYQTSLQLDIWGETSLQVGLAKVAFVGELDGYRGLWDTLDVRDARITGVFDGFEEPGEGLEAGDHRATIALDVWWKT